MNSQRGRRSHGQSSVAGPVGSEAWEGRGGGGVSPWGVALAEAEPATTAWFALRLGPSTFGIFDAFPDEAGRQAHLSGQIAAALMAKAPELLAQPPAIEKVDLLAAKLP